MDCNNKKDTHWWSHFFIDSFADVFLERNDLEKMTQEIDFIIDALNLKPGHTVFDQCCGTGTISCALAKKGIYPIGVDLSESYIIRAKAKAQKDDLTCEFYHANALSFIRQKKVDAALNWYTSFGYSDDDAINATLLKNNYDSLKPGGRFLLDYSNPAFIFGHFTPLKTVQMTLPEGTITVYIDSKVDMERGMFLSSWRYVLPNQEVVIESGESRMYFARELTDMLRSCGFKIINVQGDIHGSIFSKDSPRCIITAQK